MYKKARKGETEQFTAVSARFEEPTIADIVVDTENNSLEDCVKEVLQVMQIEESTTCDMLAGMNTTVLDQDTMFRNLPETGARQYKDLSQQNSNEANVSNLGSAT